MIKLTGTATRMTWMALGLIVALLVGGLTYSAANSKAQAVSAQISGTTSCSTSSCVN